MLWLVGESGGGGGDFSGLGKTKEEREGDCVALFKGGVLCTAVQCSGGEARRRRPREDLFAETEIRRQLDGA